MKLRFLLLLICFVLSGLSGLVYQTAWTQQFSLVFGTTELALITVLAAYMAGLTLGASLGGRLAYRLKRPLLAYGVLELAIGLSALCISPAIRYAGKLQTWLFASQELPTSATVMSSGFFYGALSFLILLVPTALMGGTLPILARWAVTEDSQVGPRMGLLYMANAGGAALGTLLAGFWLLPTFGLGATIYFAVAINILLFPFAAMLSKHSQATRKTTPRSTISSASTAEHRNSWILPIMLVSGTVSFTWEILWTRLLTHILGGSIYAFATILATFLTGIALGSAAATPFSRNPSKAATAMIVVQTMIGVLSWLSFLALNRIEDLSQWVNLSVGWAQGSLFSAVIILPGTLAIGATFPLAVRILASRAEDTASAAAKVFAWNTTGAIIGAVLTGYLILPTLRFAGSATLAIATSILLALMICLIAKPNQRATFGFVLMSLLLLLWFKPQTPWRVLQYSPLAGNQTDSQTKVGYYGVGRSGTILLKEEPSSWRLTTNGLPESAIGKPWDLPGRFVVARWLSLLPLAVNPATKSQLIIGFGAGITASDLPPPVQEVHVIEIEPEVIAANKAVPHRRLTPFDDPRLTVHINDARSALRLTQRKFDAIVSQPSHPWTSSSANLFTQEFFQNVKAHLNPEGVFVAWMGLVFTDTELLRTFVATATAVFPQVEVFRPKPNAIILVASPTTFDLETTLPMSLTIAEDDWMEMGVFVTEDVLAARVMNREEALAFARGKPPNSDYQNRFQSRAPNILKNPLTRFQANQIFQNHATAESAATEQAPGYFVRRLLRQDQIDRAMKLQQSLPPGTQQRTSLGLVLLAKGQQRAALSQFHQALKITPDDMEARAGLLQIWRRQINQGQPLPANLGPLEPSETAVVEGWRSQAVSNWQGIAQLEAQLQQIDRRHPFFMQACLLRAEWRAKLGHVDQAREAMKIMTPWLSPLPTASHLLLYAQAALTAEEYERALTAIEMVLSYSLPQASRSQILTLSMDLLNKTPKNAPLKPWRDRLLIKIKQLMSAA